MTDGPASTVPTDDAATKLRGLLRAARLRCPRCGIGPLFRGAFRMHEACPHCGFSYTREPGFYLGSIGGPAARLAQDCIRKVEVVEYPELGMEAIWRIEVVDFPAFIVVDDKGNDFFAKFGAY